MKVLQLRLKNVNSLVGEWIIDFRDARYVSDGIFAISGPTGSGKSSLMDAICLGLYGRTPRLGNLSAGSNELMSKQTGECFSEVLFQIGQEVYRATWAQRRAKGKATGQLQQPSHELAQGDGAILTTKIQDTKDKITALTGMTYEQFTQSMLLAQGDFAAFIKAGSGARAEILEKITDTAIYSRLSAFIFAQTKEEKKAYEQKKLSMEGIQLLTEEEIGQLEAGLRSLEEEKNRLNEQQRVLDQSLAWLNDLVRLEDELRTALLKQEAADLQWQGLEPTRTLLARAREAAQLGKPYSELLSARDQYARHLTELAQLREEIPETEKQVASYKSRFEKAGEELDLARQNKSNLHQLLPRLSVLDNAISQGKAAKGKLDQELGILKAEKARLEAQQMSVKQAINEIGQSIRRVDEYLTTHKADGRLKEEMSGIQHRFEPLALAEKNLANALEQKQKEQKRTNQARKELETANETLDTVAKEYSGWKEEAGRLEKELNLCLKDQTLIQWQSALEALEERQHAESKVASYHEDRLRLEAGKPCPLCGSTHHPYSTQNLPVVSETDQLVKQLRTTIQTGQELERNKKSHIDLGERIVDRGKLAREAKDKATAGLAECENELNLAAKRVEEINQNIDFQSNELTKLLNSFGIEAQDLGREKVASVVPILQKRLQAWSEKEKEKQDLEKELDGKKTDLTISESTSNMKNSLLMKTQEELALCCEELNRNLQDRHNLFGTREVEAEKQKVELEELRADQAKEGARLHLQQVENELSQKTILSGKLEEQTQRLALDAKTLEESFLIHLANRNFSSESEFVGALLHEADQARIEEDIRLADQTQNTAQALVNDTKRRLSVEAEKQVTDESLADVQLKREAVVTALNHNHYQEGTTKERVRQHQEAVSRFEEESRQLKGLYQSWMRWDHLNHLIGSADGHAYRNFAQGLTFEVLVHHANRQLARLSDRYQLVKSTGDALDLSVVDQFQAGEVRSIRNLSGGETFLVSLALALGLSGMAGQTVRVDSLFLDEGFGTLDEETLETALAALASLRQEGKMIGIISHVPILQERISTRIVVQPIREGRSQLIGPGISQGK